jgi:hypothetical protein
VFIRVHSQLDLAFTIPIRDLQGEVLKNLLTTNFPKVFGEQAPLQRTRSNSEGILPTITRHGAQAE